MRYIVVLGLVFIGVSIHADCDLKRCNDVEIDRVFMEYGDLKITLAQDSSICTGVYLVLSKYEGNRHMDRSIKTRLDAAEENGDLVSFAKLDCAVGKITYQIIVR